MQYVTALGYGLSAIAVVLYGTVAVFLARRDVSPSARSAQRGFVLWWAGLAFLGAFNLVFNDDYGLRLADLGLVPYLVVLYALILGVFAFLAGLMHYLLYLYTGKKQTLGLTILYWALMTVYLVWLLHGFGGVCMVPDDAGCVAQGWNEGDARTLGSLEQRPTWATAVWALGLLVPPLVSAVMYFVLFFRVQDATARYRVLLISGGIILWFAFSTANSLAGIGSEEDASNIGRLVGQALGLLAATLVLLAYFPPRAVRRRYGVKSLSDQTT